MSAMEHTSPGYTSRPSTGSTTSLMATISPIGAPLVRSTATEPTCLDPAGYRRGATLHRWVARPRERAPRGATGQSTPTAIDDRESVRTTRMLGGRCGGQLRCPAGFWAAVDSGRRRGRRSGRRVAGTGTIPREGRLGDVEQDARGWVVRWATDGRLSSTRTGRDTSRSSHGSTASPRSSTPRYVRQSCTYWSPKVWRWPARHG